MSQINKNNYFLVNSKYEISLVTSFINKQNTTNVKIIATSKAAISECIKNGIPFQSIESFTAQEEVNELGHKTINLLSDIINFSDNFLINELTKLAELKIYPFKFNALRLKILIDTISAKILFFKNFLQKTDASESIIHIYTNYEVTLFTNNGLFNEYENLYLRIIDQFQINNFSLFKVGYYSSHPGSFYSSNIENKKNTIYKKYKNFIKQRINYFNKTKASFVIFDYGHDIKYLEHILLENNYKKFFITEASNLIDYFYNNLWKKINKENKFRNFFKYEDISYFKIIKPILKSFIIDEIPRAIITYEKNIQAIKNSNIKFAITGSINVGLVARSAMLALQSKNIPIITYTEGGGYGQFVSPHHHNEFTDGDILFCYGKGNVEYIKSLNLKNTKKLIPVGSIKQRIIFDKAKNLKTPKKINSVMFVPSIYNDNAFVAPFNGLTPCASFLSHVKITRYLISIKSKINININIKPHPDDIILTKILKLNEFSESLNYVNGKLEDKLKDIDIFILDFPSTTLLELISTKSYVFLLNENNAFKFTDVQKELLDKRVYIFNHFDEMKTAIDSVVKNNKLYPIKEDNSFLINYAFQDDEINQINHVFDEIKKLMNKDTKDSFN